MNGSLIPRPVALVGLPGAGKTTVGTLLASRLVLPFFDSDAEIERASGETIANLFAAHGEGHFRDLERATIDRLLGAVPLVLATGGGAMAQSATRRILQARAVTIWLDAPLALLAARLEGQQHRPLLTSDLNQRLETLRHQREISYRAAAHRIDATSAPDVVVTSILNAIAG